MENFLGSLGFDVWQAVSTGKVDTQYDSTAKMAITDGLADSVRVRVSGCETAMTLWDRLQTLYGDESAFKAHASPDIDSTSEIDSGSSDECSIVGLEDHVPEVDLTGELRAAQDELRLEREKLTVASCDLHSANETISTLKTQVKDSSFVITALEAQVISRDEMCRAFEREITTLRAQLTEGQMSQVCTPHVVEEITRCTVQSEDYQRPSTTSEHGETSKRTTEVDMNRPQRQSSSKAQRKSQSKRQRKRVQRHSDARLPAHQAQYNSIPQQRMQKHSDARPSVHQAQCRGIPPQRAQEENKGSMQSDSVNRVHQQRPIEQSRFSRSSHQRHRQQVFQQRHVVHTMRHGPTPSWHRHSLVRQSHFHGYCHRCNGYGHRSANCTSRFCISNYGRKTSTSPRMRPVECLRCHTLGHWAKRCKAVLTPQLAQAEREYQLSRTRKRKSFRSQAKKKSQFNGQSHVALYSVWRKKTTEKSSVGMNGQRQRTVVELIDRHSQKTTFIEKPKQRTKVIGHVVWREKHIEECAVIPTTPTSPKLGVRGSTPPRH